MKHTTVKRGRPTGLTPEVQKTIYTAIVAGSFIETALALAGVPRSTFYDWIKRGRNEEAGPFRELSDIVKKGLAIAEMKYVTVIGEASKTQWQAAAWMLERRFKENWAKDRHSSPGNHHG